MHDSLTPMDRADVMQLLRDGRAADAEAVCRHALAARPDDPQALDVLAGIIYERGPLAEALKVSERAVALAPMEPAYRVKLAALLCAASRAADAVRHLRQGLRVRDDLPELHNNLGIALKQLGRTGEAVAAFQRATGLRPQYVEAHFNLGGALRKAGHLGESIAAYQTVVALCPAFAAAHARLAELYGEQARQEEAIACRRRELDLLPANAAVHSDLLFTLHYSPTLSPQRLLEEAMEWGRRHDTRPGILPPADNDRTPDQRLRFGYLSPDFRAHTIAHFIEPLLQAHDRSHFEAYCYSAVMQPDPVTDRLRKLADVWREVRDLDDDSAARLIRQDGIDILVDLTGHMAATRLLVLARRPAPVQVQLGYAGTTGLPQIDYRITDNHCDPPRTEAFYTERLVRLPDCAWLYKPSDPSPEVGPLPALSAGHVRFGCLNKLVKVTDEAIALWGRIMQLVPGSRLVLLGPSENAQLIARFARHGIAAERIEVASRCPRDRYLELFNRIDIALDPFPYNGDTTTCDGFWMGVPLVTLAGEAFVSRRGVSHLMNLGLGELVAQTPEQYVQIAVALAGDLERLSGLRATLRQRLLASPLCDAPRYTAHLEAAYRQMWRAWCRTPC